MWQDVSESFNAEASAVANEESELAEFLEWDLQHLKHQKAMLCHDVHLCSAKKSSHPGPKPLCVCEC